ncbi:hypothetical protein GCM10023189_53310 [Nibrella saemangeumensis]|uniref:Small multi-drug export protein n=1 Tax=Nibrella saemangeumensis TaxID=1084526 RepID=A0ABP8NN10_9BACT
MDVAKYITVILASALKFIGGPLTGIAMGLSWIQTAVCTVAGMMLAVVAVAFAGEMLRQLSQRISKKPPRRFNRRTRMAVKIWKRSGMLGIALLTPLILTPIGGTVLAVSYRVHRGQIFLYMLISAVFWSVVFTLATYNIPGLQELFD